jgi:hypothetical protein
MAASLEVCFSARELARDARVLQKATRAPAARQEDLTVWVKMEKVKQSQKGSRTYT